MSLKPQQLSLTVSNGVEISLSPEFYFQLLDDPEAKPGLLHLGNNGKLIIHDLEDLPYKIAFIWRNAVADPSNDEKQVKHIVEFIPKIIQQLPARSTTNVCLFLVADKAIIFVNRLQEILFVKLHGYKIADDILYHLMNAISVCKLNTDPVHLIVCGEIAADSSLMNHLGRYFAQITCKPISLESL